MALELYRRKQEEKEVDTVKTHTYSISQVGSALTNTAGEIEFNLATATIADTSGGLFDVVDDSANTRTKFVATSIISVVASFVAETPNITGKAQIFKNGAAIMEGNQAYTASRNVSTSTPIHLEIGDYLTFAVVGDTASSTNITFVNITAIGITKTKISDL